MDCGLLYAHVVELQGVADDVFGMQLLVDYYDSVWQAETDDDYAQQALMDEYYDEQVSDDFDEHVDADDIFVEQVGIDGDFLEEVEADDDVDLLAAYIVDFGEHVAGHV